MDNEDDFRVESTPNSSDDGYGMDQFDETPMGDSLYASRQNIVNDIANAVRQANQTQSNSEAKQKRNLADDEAKQAQQENTKATKDSTKAAEDSTKAILNETQATKDDTVATKDSTQATKDETTATKQSTQATVENTKTNSQIKNAIEKTVGANTAALNRLADRTETVIDIARQNANLPANGFMSLTKAAQEQRAQADEARDKARSDNNATVDKWVKKQDRPVRDQFLTDMQNPGMAEWASAMPQQYIQYLDLTNKIRNRKTTTDKNFNPSKQQADRLTTRGQFGEYALEHDKTGWHTPSNGLFAEIGDPTAVWNEALTIMRTAGEIPYKYVPQNLKDQFKNLIKERDTYLKQNRKFANFGTIDDLLKTNTKDGEEYIPDNRAFSLFGDERILRPELWAKSREKDAEYAGRAGLYVFNNQQRDDIQNGNLGSLPKNMAEFVYAMAAPQTRMTMLAGGTDAVAALQEGAKKETAQIAMPTPKPKTKKKSEPTTAEPKTDQSAAKTEPKVEDAATPKINTEKTKHKKKSTPRVEQPKLHANAGGGSGGDEPPVDATADFDDDEDWQAYRKKLRGDRSLGLNNFALADFVTKYVRDVTDNRNIQHWDSTVGGKLGDWGAELAERIAIIQNEKLTQYNEANGIYATPEQKAKQFAKLINQTGKTIRDNIRNTMALQARAGLGTLPVGSPFAIKYGTIETQMKMVNNAKLRIMSNTAYAEAQDYKRQADEQTKADKLRDKQFKEQERQGAKENQIRADENRWQKWDKNNSFKARTLSEDELADMTEDELLEWIEAERVRTIKFNAERKARYDATHTQKSDRAPRAHVNKEAKDRVTDLSDYGKKLKREWKKIHHPDEFMAENLRNDLRMEAGRPINTYGWRGAIGDFGAGGGVTGQAHGWIMDKMFYHGERAMRWRLNMAKHITADDLKDKGFKGAVARKIMTFKDANGNTITKAWSDMTPLERNMFQLSTMRSGFMQIARWGGRLLPVVAMAAAAGRGTAWVRDVRNRTLNNGTNAFQAGANTIEDAIFDVGHLFGFSANTGKDIREDRQEALSENYGIFSNRGMELINSNMWARSYGLTTEADKEYIREQVALGKSAEQVRQSFLNLKQVSEQTGISFKNLSQDVAQQATAADKETGNSVGIVQGTAQADKALMAAGFETSSLSSLSENQAFQWAEMMALGASGHSQAAAEAQGDPQLLLTEALKYNVFPQALQRFKNLEYSMSGGSEIMEANQLYQQGIKLNDFQTGVDTMYTQAKYGATTQQSETALNITLSDGLTGEIVNRGLYEGGLYDTTGTGKYFAMNNKGSQSAQGSNEG